ncbi:hypothetical protein DL766_008315 [Monosporascus sp. MC13-8B]|uniref:Uncharacterized protein n=1 Tax=Monosporascus cannonballus TaxID=155416 RepID=A0ABY0GXX6_9PEZI|nr:hypothetical protein DL762_007855 [Monosporascus cannonballus]RYO82398.1 hypothetical protein DL763_008249 [Monosporascus cannonballus]RYP19961.1 hypothetical protein DL766_008315 [Monosporascus sp. MC13-8B]
MAPPMFTVPSELPAEKKAQVHLLPCRVHHDGNVGPVESFWSPTEGQDGEKTTYFRGRKLHGKTMKLPEGYHGSVVEKSQPGPEKRSREEMTKDIELQEEQDDPIEVGAMRGKSTFDEVVVWGHETTAESGADPYVRSMEEWISFAEQIHAYPAQEDPRGG